MAALQQRTRYRKRLIEAHTAEGQRLSKVLEDAQFKIDSVASELLGVSGRVAEAAAPFEKVITRLMTIPGIGRRIAEVIVAETGGDMARFASSARLAAWSGLAPGDNESAGAAGSRPGAARCVRYCALPAPRRACPYPAVAAAQPLVASSRCTTGGLLGPGVHVQLAGRVAGDVLCGTSPAACPLWPTGVKGGVSGAG